MGWKCEISSLEELEALMCDNIIPESNLPDAFYTAGISSGARRLILYLSKIHAKYAATKRR